MSLRDRQRERGGAIFGAGISEEEFSTNYLDFFGALVGVVPF